MGIFIILILLAGVNGYCVCQLQICNINSGISYAKFDIMQYTRKQERNVMVSQSSNSSSTLCIIDVPVSSCRSLVHGDVYSYSYGSQIANSFRSILWGICLSLSLSPKSCLCYSNGR